MNRRVPWRGWTLALVLTGSTALAADTLSVRLVEATNDGTGIDGRLRDVAAAFGDLSFNSYRLVDAADFSIPAGQTRGMGGYEVTCAGERKALVITVKLGRRELLNTTVSLRANKPLVVGGFPSPRGRMILVFVAR
jgi:hypothetical protein